MVLFRNRYYSDAGLQYAFSRLKSEFELLGVSLNCLPTPFWGYGSDCSCFLDLQEINLGKASEKIEQRNALNSITKYIKARDLGFGIDNCLVERKLNDSSVSVEQLGRDVAFGDKDARVGRDVALGNEDARVGRDVAFGNKDARVGRDVAFGNKDARVGRDVAFGNEDARVGRDVAFGNEDTRVGRDVAFGDKDARVGRDVIFWDKDARVGRALERIGFRLYPNSAEALQACDDKELTYACLNGGGIPLIKTISAPLVFDVCVDCDDLFLNYVEAELGYPIVVKENVGSQGKQVYLAKNRTELVALNASLLHRPHIYQQFCGEQGCDIRVYVIGGEAVASVRRKNTTDFKSNVAMGGTMELCPLNDRLKELAEKVAALLGLNYGSVDFLSEKEPLFLEANSNAYFGGIESLGVPIARMLAEFVVKKMKSESKLID